MISAGPVVSPVSPHTFVTNWFRDTISPPESLRGGGGGGGVGIEVAE